MDASKPVLTISDLVQMTYYKRVGLLAALFTIVICGSYLAILTITKKQELQQKISVMVSTLDSGLTAGDWAMALDHMKTSIKAGGLSEVDLSQIKANEIVSGPFLSDQMSFFPICSSRALTLRPNLLLNACVALITPSEGVTLLFVFVLAIVLIVISGYFLNNVIQSGVNALSSQIEQMRATVSGEASERIFTASRFNTVEFVELMGRIKLTCPPKIGPVPIGLI